MKVSDAIKKLQRLDPDSTIVFAEWSADDVKYAAQNCYYGDDIDLTDDAIAKIAKIAEDSHDASVGINWDALEAAAAYYAKTVKEAE